MPVFVIPVAPKNPQPTFSLHFDKLTLLLDPPDSWKVGVIGSVMANLKDPDFHGKYGLVPVNGKARARYRVAVEGKAPTSLSPLTWSQETAFLLQLDFRESKANFQSKPYPWLRLDINPRALRSAGFDHLKMVLADVVGLDWACFSFAEASRVDIAVDLPNVAMKDWVFDIKKRRRRNIIRGKDQIETIYIGSKKYAPVCIYDKGRQDPDFAGGKVMTRVEARLKGIGPLAGVRKLENPFSQLIVFDPVKPLSPPLPEPHRIALLSVGQLHGLSGILATFPKEERPKRYKALLAARAPWWNPAAIWDQWQSCCLATLPSRFDKDGNVYGSVVAFEQSLAMQQPQSQPLPTPFLDAAD